MSGDEVKLIDVVTETLMEWCVAEEDVTDLAEELVQRVTLFNPYAQAYAILMEYWDILPDDDKPEVDEQLRKLGL